MSALQSVVDAVALGSLIGLVALGIGLVFGVMRLVNFAYGELIAAGAYALALTNHLPMGVSILTCVGVVIALSLLMDLGYRPLRGAAPVTMLVATFAVSFTLQAVLFLAFDPRGKNIGVLSELNKPLEIGELRIRWVTFAAIGLGILLLAGTALILGRTSIGLQMRAASADFTTARILGVRAKNVIRFAFVLAGFLAAVVALMVSVQRPLATPTYGLTIMIPALIGVVVGGMDRLGTATLGGFSVGFATSILGEALPAGGRVFLESVVFGLVIVVLLIRPGGLFRRARAAERV
jgi:branched-chain amino acid transport system permease protein